MIDSKHPINSGCLQIFIGYDPVESIAWHTMAHSILSRSSVPIALIPLNLRNLSRIFKRPRDKTQSNEFSYSRFLVPFLSRYEGYSLYFDCDMLIRTDINDIFACIEKEPDKALYVVKHDYVPKTSTKYLGNIQHVYPRKNWSSVVLWNCAHPKNRIVNPTLVQTESGSFLHRFCWLDDEDIGNLDKSWNWLVGEYDDPPSVINNLHWTIGGPYFKDYQEADYASEWLAEFHRMSYCKQRD